jgi:hypothetical protein
VCAACVTGWETVPACSTGHCTREGSPDRVPGCEECCPMDGRHCKKCASTNERPSLDREACEVCDRTIPNCQTCVNSVEGAGGVNEPWRCTACKSGYMVPAGALPEGECVEEECLKPEEEVVEAVLGERIEGCASCNPAEPKECAACKAGWDRVPPGNALPVTGCTSNCKAVGSTHFVEGCATCRISTATDANAKNNCATCEGERRPDAAGRSCLTCSAAIPNCETCVPTAAATASWAKCTKCAENFELREEDTVCQGARGLLIAFVALLGLLVLA